MSVGKARCAAYSTDCASPSAPASVPRLLVNGEVYAGARGAAGEIGYSLIGALGPIARASGYGPLEAFAAGPGIARRYVEQWKEAMSPAAAATDELERG